MRAAPEEHPVLVVESALTPVSHREKATQIMFETFSVPAFFLATAPLLTARACARSTALVVDVGEGDAQIVPIVEGCVRRSFRLALLAHERTNTAPSFDRPPTSSC